MTEADVTKCGACGTTFTSEACWLCGWTTTPPKKKQYKPRLHKEDDEQAALIAWRDTAWRTLPGLELLHSVPNGGRRDTLEAMRLKATGVTAGVPDLDLPVARGGYFGLRIEMKVDDNPPSVDQERWIKRLNDEGYLAMVCQGWDHARTVITAYLRRPPTVVAR